MTPEEIMLETCKLLNTMWPRSGATVMTQKADPVQHWLAPEAPAGAPAPSRHLLMTEKFTYTLQVHRPHWSTVTIFTWQGLDEGHQIVSAGFYPVYVEEADLASSDWFPSLAEQVIGWEMKAGTLEVILELRAEAQGPREKALTGV